MGDYNEKLRKKATETLKKMGNCPAIGNAHIVNTIATGKNLKNTFKNSPKHL